MLALPLDIKPPTLNIEQDELVELFDTFTIFDENCDVEEGDLFKVFPEHDYFLEKLYFEREFRTRWTAIDDFDEKVEDGNDIDDKKTSATNKTTEHAAEEFQIVEETIETEKGKEDRENLVDKAVNDNDSKAETVETDDDGKMINNSLSKKYGIRSDISDEDLTEVLVLFDEVVSVTIRDMLKQILVEKLLEKMELK